MSTSHFVTGQELKKTCVQRPVNVSKSDNIFRATVKIEKQNVILRSFGIRVNSGSNAIRFDADSRKKKL